MQTTSRTLAKWRFKTAVSVSILALSAIGYAATGNTASVTTENAKKDKDHANSVKTESPIKHVIILIGENRGLDHTFGVYKPKGKNQTISNILSKGIVNADGTPGPNFAQAQQFSVAGQPAYYLGAPNAAKFPYSATNAMPQPNTAGTPTTSSDTAP